MTVVQRSMMPGRMPATAGTTPIHGCFLQYNSATSRCELQPFGNLNAGIGIQNLPLLSAGNPLTWLLQPLAVTELLGNQAGRLQSDLSAMLTGRLIANVTIAGAANAALKVQYSLNAGTAWTDLFQGNAGATAAVGVGVATVGTRVGGWKFLNVTALTDVLLRAVGLGGNGVTGPAFGSIILSVRPNNGTSTTAMDSP